MYGEYRAMTEGDKGVYESSPHVRGILPTRVNPQSSCISHSFCVMDELRIFLNGGPQAGNPAILFLACNPKATRPFILSRLSQARLSS